MKPARWRQLDSLYNQAREMDDTKRAAFLREACGDDDELKREIEELFVEEKAAESFLEEPALREIAHEFAATATSSWIGRQIGNYEFVSLAGVGGMGEVYRAHDTKLKREVAIKVLPDEFSRESGRIRRFQREAQLLASLNHPNIAAIYGLEEEDESLFLILEFVEGETLAERIKRGPIALEVALELSLQIADALTSAHEKNVIHRDLKPANIKVTPDRKVKVLDFGLAKALLGEAGDLSNSPTVSMASTQEGVILGTPSYMPPEQVRGGAVDRRADVWALGCVLYEMLTGLKAFPGEGVSDILASVLKSEPDWNRLPEDIPAAIRRLLQRCLRKDQSRRLQTAVDVRIEIEDAGLEPELAGSGTAINKPRRREILAWIAAGAGTALAGAFGVSYLRRPDVLPSQIFTPPTTDPLSFAISPDGQSLVFVAGEKEPQLWLRPIASEDPIALPGTEGATSPFWKPDSRSIAFFAHGTLKRIDVGGGNMGSPQTLATMPVLLSRGGAWSPEGIILFPLDAVTGLFRLPEIPPGAPEPVTMPTKDQSRHSSPCFLPDGRKFLCYVPGSENGAIFIGSLDSTTIQRVTASDCAGAYLLSGYLVFVSQKVLVAQRFDPASGNVSGAISQIGPVALQGGVGAFSVSATTGHIAYRAPFSEGRQLTWLDAKGNRLDLFGSEDNSRMASPAISPNGLRVAVEGSEGMKILDPTPQPFVRGRSPIWSSDGRSIVYYRRTPESDWGLFMKPFFEKGEEILVADPPEFKAACDWFENRLLYFKLDPKTRRRSLWVQQVANDGKRTGEPKVFPNLNPDWDEFNGRFSPDGRMVAYQSNETKRLEIRVVPYLGNYRSVQVSLEGGIWPRWGPDGKELYYLRLDGMLMSVGITVNDSQLGRGETRALWRPQIMGFNVDLHSSYDVAREGKRKGQLLINGPVERTVSTPITLIPHWKPPAA